MARNKHSRGGVNRPPFSSGRPPHPQLLTLVSELSALGSGSPRPSVQAQPPIHPDLNTQGNKGCPFDPGTSHHQIPEEEEDDEDEDRLRQLEEDMSGLKIGMMKIDVMLQKFLFNSDRDEDEDLHQVPNHQSNLRKEQRVYQRYKGKQIQALEGEIRDGDHEGSRAVGRGGDQHQMNLGHKYNPARGSNPTPPISKFPFPKTPKMEIPVYKGEGDVLCWLYQLEHYFSIQNSLNELEKVDFCKFFLKEDALIWFQWLESN